MANLKRADSREPATGSVSSVSGLVVNDYAIPVGSINAKAVAIVDASGLQITSFGGGTQYTNGVVAAANPIGTGIIFNNGGTYAFVSAAVPLPVTGSLTVGGTIDNSAFTAGTTTGTPSMGFYHSTIDTVTDGRAAALAIDSKRNLFVVLRDAAGNARGVNVDANNNLGVALAAETTKVLGVVRTADGSGNLLTSTSNALDINIKTIAAALTLATVTTVTTVSTVTAVTTVTNLGAGNAAATIAADAVTPTVPGIAAYGFLKTPGANTWDRAYSIVNANDTTGTGIQAVGLMGQFDDTSPGTVTENRFGNVRMSVRREVYNQIRDAAGNERGLNIDASGRAGVVATNSHSDSYGSATALTITLGSLASSVVGVGRQSTLVDNTTNLFDSAKIYCKVTTGTSPTLNSYIYVYLILYDNSALADDNAGTTDAGLTVINASLLGSILVNSASNNIAYYKSFDTATITRSLGPKWGVAVVNSTGAALNSTGGNHVLNYIGAKKQLN